MDKLLTLNYYFDPSPGADFQFTKLTLVLIILLFLLSIAIRIYRRKYAKDAVLKKMLKRYPGRFFTFGIILLFLLLSREAGIPYLSMRFWWFVLFIYIIYWAVKVSLNCKKEYRHRLWQAQSSDALSKYLPKKKK